MITKNPMQLKAFIKKKKVKSERAWGFFSYQGDITGRQPKETGGRSDVIDTGTERLYRQSRSVSGG